MTARQAAARSLLRLREYTLLVLLAALWGGSYPLVKISLESIPPVSLMAFRVTLAALVLCAIAWQLGHSFPRDRNTWLALLVQSFFNSIGAWTLLAWGQQYIDSGIAGVLNSTSPIFVFLITLLWTRHESVGLLRFAGVVLGLLGVGLVFGADPRSLSGTGLAAQLAVLAGAFLYALAAIPGRRFHGQLPVVTAAATMIWAGMFLCPVAAMLERPWQIQVSSESALAAITLGFFSTAIALLIYFRLLLTIGSMGVASQSYLRSMFAVGFGVLFLDEPMSTGLLIGVGTVIGGMLLLNTPSPALRGGPPVAVAVRRRPTPDPVTTARQASRSAEWRSALAAFP